MTLAETVFCFKLAVPNYTSSPPELKKGGQNSDQVEIIFLKYITMWKTKIKKSAKKLYAKYQTFARN